MLRIPLFMLLVFLTACAANPKSPEVQAEPDPLAEMLASTAKDARTSLAVLAETNNAVAQKQLTAEQRREALIAASYTPPGFDRRLTLQWIGELRQALSTLGEATGYRLETQGKPPRTPILVSIDSVDQPAVLALRDIVYQAGERAAVTVVEKTRTIQLGYKQ